MIANCVAPETAAAPSRDVVLLLLHCTRHCPDSPLVFVICPRLCSWMGGIAALNYYRENYSATPSQPPPTYTLWPPFVQNT